MNDQKPLVLAALIGIDWSDQKHDVALLDLGKEDAPVEESIIAHSPDTLASWIMDLRKRFGGRPIGVAIESSRGPLVNALLDHDFIVLFPVNPLSLKQFRKAFSPSGAKDDAPDARLLLEMLQKHRNHLKAWLPESVEVRKLKRLTHSRREAVNLRTKLVQQLGAALKEYFPQAIDWVGDLTTPLGADFLLRWPTLQQLKRAKAATIRRFYQEHNSRRRDLIDARIREIQAAVALTTDPAIIESEALVVQTLAGQLQVLAPSIARFDDVIAECFEATPEAAIFNSFPGSGRALAPRLSAAFGSDRSKFNSAEEVQQFAGVAPVTERSGQRTFVHWRWSCDTFLRQSFHEFAAASVHRSQWARHYYAQQRARGKGHHAAVRALAYKWIRIMWRCWKDSTPYDEQRYIESLRTRGSILAAKLAAVPA